MSVPVVFRRYLLYMRLPCQLVHLKGEGADDKEVGVLLRTGLREGPQKRAKSLYAQLADIYLIRALHSATA